MVTATKKKASKKATSKKKPAKAPAKAKQKASAKKPVAKKKATTKKPAAAKTAPKPVAPVKAKARNDEPDRSSPAMAEVDADVLEFIAAIDEFKQANGRPFPSWSEVLLVVRQLGYRRQ